MKSQQNMESGSDREDGGHIFTSVVEESWAQLLRPSFPDGGEQPMPF